MNSNMEHERLSEIDLEFGVGAPMTATRGEHVSTRKNVIKTVLCVAGIAAVGAIGTIATVDHSHPASTEIDHSSTGRYLLDKEPTATVFGDCLGQH